MEAESAAVGLRHLIKDIAAQFRRRALAQLEVQRVQAVAEGANVEQQAAGTERTALPGGIVLVKPAVIVEAESSAVGLRHLIEDIAAQFRRRALAQLKVQRVQAVAEGTNVEHISPLTGVAHHAVARSVVLVEPVVHRHRSGFCRQGAEQEKEED